MTGSDSLVTRRDVLRAGAAAATAGGATGAAAAQEDGESGDEVVVDVGPGSSNRFEPEEVFVEPGTTVRWVWRSAGHNVHATEVPEGADWSVQTEITGPPHEYSHTFDGPEGTYHYVCDPHVSVGMEGDVVVTTDPPEDTGYQSVLPESAKTLGVAAVGGLGAVLGMTYFFMRYGGDYGEGGTDLEE